MRLHGEITEETVWISAHGIKTKFKDMDDTYLANMMDFLKKRYKSMQMESDKQILNIIQNLCDQRGLKKEFIERAQIPYKNPNDKWEIWSFQDNKPMEIQV